MICLAVHRSDSLVCMAGIAEGSMLTSIIAGGVGDEHPASFYVAGMQDLPVERSAHVFWVHERPLSAGDRLRFTLIESDDASAPIEIKATDSQEYLEEQREFEQIERHYVPPIASPPRRWPALELGLRLREESPVRARLPLDQEHIMCSLLWDKWSPERCRVYVRSFTGFAQGTQRKTTDWLRGDLHVGDSFELSVLA